MNIKHLESLYPFALTTGASVMALLGMIVWSFI